MALERMTEFLDRGGPALWVIAGLSVLTVALILWKLWRLALIGAWSRGRAETLLARHLAGAAPPLAPDSRNLRLRFVSQALSLRAGPLPDAAQREEIARLAQQALADLRAGLRPLDLIVTIAPLVGLLGTVLGMIAAFQALQEAGGGAADPSVLAGGIWEALLTTAAGMAVAIPAAVALSGFDGVAERVQADLEDLATRAFVHTGTGRGAA